MQERQYIIIDLKSFYASVECAERHLNTMTTNLVVADPDRSKNTICLAVSPSLKALGVKNRCRVQDIPKAISYITAKPRMQLYIDYSAAIYRIYLEYVAKEDIHVYSVDEAFLDVTDYLPLYHLTARQLGQKIMDEIWDKLCIRATCGIGTNLYLAKIALDITAKHTPDFIGELTEESYRKTLWTHKPLTDFWRIGPGIARRLAKYGIFDMQQVAEADEDLLYREFGVDAELLIDHAWGRETTTMADIHNYRSQNSSLSNGQVLMRDYNFEDGRLVVKEMTDLLCLDLVEKGLLTRSVNLMIGFANDAEPPVGGTVSLEDDTNADMLIVPAVAALYDRVVPRICAIRRINVTCNNVIPEEYQQYNLFMDTAMLEKDRKAQQAAIALKNRFGKDAVLKGMNLLEGATTRMRNHQIGGHNSGE